MWNVELLVSLQILYNYRVLFSRHLSYIITLLKYSHGALQSTMLFTSSHANITFQSVTFSSFSYS